MSDLKSTLTRENSPRLNENWSIYEIKLFQNTKESGYNMLIELYENNIEKNIEKPKSYDEHNKEYYNREYYKDFFEFDKTQLLIKIKKYYEQKKEALLKKIKKYDKDEKKKLKKIIK